MAKRTDGLEKGGLSYSQRGTAGELLGLILGFAAAAAGLGFIVWWAIDSAKRIFEGR